MIDFPWENYSDCKTLKRSEKTRRVLMTIGILGGGNGAHAAACDMTLKGFSVRLFEDSRFAEKMRIVFDTREIEYSGILGEGKVKLELVSSDLGQTIKGAEVIIIAAPAFVHSYYAELLADKLEDGQIVLFLAGTLGSLVLKKHMKKKGCKKDVIFAETHTLPYKTRLLKPGHSLVMGYMLPLLTAVLPARRKGEVMQKLKALYNCTLAETVAECTLSSLNPMVHVPTCLLNCGRIELAQGKFRFYREGITPRVGAAIEAIDKERITIAKALGYEPLNVNTMIAPAGVSPELSVYEIFSLDKEVADIKGPAGLQDRYYTEDIPFGLVTWSLLARTAGVETPILDALITLGTVVLGEDCRKTGRSAGDLGIEGMDLTAFKDYLWNG
jgi:opine dehydrogenase